MIGRTLAITLFLLAGQVWAQDPEPGIISGLVVDANSGQPIDGATIATDTDVYPARSNAAGEFRFVALWPRERIELKITKEGYQLFKKDLERKPELVVEVQLKPLNAVPKIALTEFVGGRHLRGRVTGIPAGEHEDHKVLVYVLTDKWYVHPYAENAEGRGYARVGEDGAWRIETVWRGYQAYKLAMLLTRKEVQPPPVVPVYSLDPEQELLSAIPTVASEIVEAPAGI